MLLTWTVAHAQKISLAEVAASLSGTWKVNRDLSDALSDPARGRRGGALFATRMPMGQRGGRGGGGGDAANTSADLTPDELAARTPNRATLDGYAKPRRGWERLYVDHVLQADQGADLDFLVGSSGSQVSRESH